MKLFDLLLVPIEWASYINWMKQRLLILFNSLKFFIEFFLKIVLNIFQFLNRCNKLRLAWCFLLIFFIPLNRCISSEVDILRSFWLSRQCSNFVGLCLDFQFWKYSWILSHYIFGGIITFIFDLYLAEYRFLVNTTYIEGWRRAYILKVFHFLYFYFLFKFFRKHIYKKSFK